MRYPKFDSWEKNIKGRFADSQQLLADVWRGSYLKEKHKKRPKVMKKALNGELLGRSAVSGFVVASIAKREANLAIAKAADGLMIGDLNLAWSDDDVAAWCEAKAAACARLLTGSPMPAWEIRELLREYGMELPVGCLFGLDGALARTCCERWWRRRARALKMRTVDEVARSVRLVNASGQHYCSDELVRLRRRQAHRNKSILEGMVAENEDGQKYTLAELAELSTSNPSVRRSELMVRMRGFETIADDFGHEGMFITLTAPSAFHPSRQIKVKGRVVNVVDNPRWEGGTVRDAQGWLNKMWRRIRAAWGKLEIRPYGFRVVEPHADGCPHWHLLLFFNPEQVDSAMEIVREKMLDEYGSEPGADKYRVKIVVIDKARGSATGYIAKYISKNIDGSNIDKDFFGNDAVVAAERITACMAGHGVRQFQQIGGASVQVWRELRRMDGADGIVEVARQAADESDWAAYCLVMGGVGVRRGDQPIKLGRWIETKLDTESGCYVDIDRTVGTYGDESIGKIYGLVAFGKNYLTRFYRWTVDRAGKGFRDFLKSAASIELRVSMERVAKISLFGLPFTPVDDCEFEDYLRGAGDGC